MTFRWILPPLFCEKGPTVCLANLLPSESVLQIEDLIIYQGLAMTQYLKDVALKKLYRVHNLEHKIWVNLAHQNRHPIKRNMR
jgi:hypothetical protein